MNALKDFGKKTREVIHNSLDICKRGYAKLAIFMACWLTPMVAFAEPDSGGVQDAIGGLLYLLSWVIGLVGVFLLIYGVVQIINGFRNEDADRQQKGIAGAIVAILLIANKPIVNFVLETIGSDIQIGDSLPF